MPSGGLYATYHLLGEPETTIDNWVIICYRFHQKTRNLKKLVEWDMSSWSKRDVLKCWCFCFGIDVVVRLHNGNKFKVTIHMAQNEDCEQIHTIRNKSGYRSWHERRLLQCFEPTNNPCLRFLLVESFLFAIVSWWLLVIYSIHRPGQIITPYSRRLVTPNGGLVKESPIKCP